MRDRLLDAAIICLLAGAWALSKAMLRMFQAVMWAVEKFKKPGGKR